MPTSICALLIVVSTLGPKSVLQSPVMGPTIPEQVAALEGRPFTSIVVADLPFYSLTAGNAEGAGSRACVMTPGPRRPPR